MLGHLSRRDLLRSGTSATAALLIGTTFNAPGQAATPPTLDQFIALSRKMTDQSSLDSDMGQNILSALIATGQADALAALIADPTPARSPAPVADAVVAAWYSGLSPVPGARAVTGFNEALVWNALTYTKPWGNCGGEMGYWGELPAGAEP